MAARPPVSARPEHPPALSRRDVLRSGAVLAGGLLAGGALAACGGEGQPTATPARGPLGLGSNHSDEVPRRALAEVVEAFTAATGIEVRVNTVDHGTFQDQISAYLQGRPDDVFTWFAGYRMRFFAERGLAGDLSAVWADVGSGFSDGFRAASMGLDGRPYFVPFYNYPWVLLYRPSLWQRLGYEPPATLPELVALADRMRADGLVPVAFGNRDGWPAMGWFDILDLRLNGYDFHIGLLDGRESWLDPRVRTVFERWRELLPLLQPAAAGRTWQEAAQAMLNEQAGMFFCGTFAGEQATPEQREDVALATFPLLGTGFDAEHALDAPINGFMMRRDPVDQAAAEAFLRFVARGPVQDTWTAANPNHVAAADDADRSGYVPLQRQAAEIIAEAGRIAQFFDRDTRPDFAGKNGMQAYFQDFLADPERDLEVLLGLVQDLWDSLA